MLDVFKRMSCLDGEVRWRLGGARRKAMSRADGKGEEDFLSCAVSFSDLCLMH